jgi:hypothetical protein
MKVVKTGEAETPIARPETIAPGIRRSQTRSRVPR